MRSRWRCGISRISSGITTHISQAQQARGVELGRKEKLFTRLKNSVGILLPLIHAPACQRIDVISSAMELRGFGKNRRKRTWYMAPPNEARRLYRHCGWARCFCASA